MKLARVKMLGLTSWSLLVIIELFREELRSHEEENVDNDELKNRLSEDMLGHLGGDDVGVLVHWLPLQEVVCWGLGGEGQRSECVHDQVNLGIRSRGLPKASGRLRRLTLW